MSLLLEALKKAEKAKEEAQKRAREGEGEGDASGELRLADEQAAPADEKRVVTRDELPPITAPLEIQSEDLGAAGAQELSLQGAPRPATSPARPRPEPQAAQRAAARKPFEAKVREPNPRLPFYLTVGALGVLCVATAIYFWIQLRPPASLYISNPKPPAGEQPVAVAPPQARPGPEATSASAIPGLPTAPVAASEAKPAPPPARPPQAEAAPGPAPRVGPRPRVRPSAAESAPASRPVRTAVSPSRPPARIHPLVSSGYAAYQAGDMERARLDYQSALRDEPGNRDALLGLAAVETRAGRFANAEMLYRRLLQMDPRDPHAQAGLLGLRSAEVSPVRAESRLKGMIANDSTEAVLYFSLGNQYAQQGRWPEAQRAYAKAAAMDSENPDFAYNYAVSLEHVKQPLAALQQYRRALALALRHNASFDSAAVQARVETLSR